MCLRRPRSQKKTRQDFLSYVYPPCNSLCTPFFVFLHHFSLSFIFFSFFLSLYSLSLFFLPDISVLYFSASLYHAVQVFLLAFSGFLERRRQVGLIIVQVFFKEWITRSIFTVSFSLSSGLSSCRFLFPVSLRGCASWCIQGIKETVNGRSELFTNVISFTPCRAFVCL